MKDALNRRFLLTAASAGLVVPSLLATGAFAESAIKAGEMKAAGGKMAGAEDYEAKTLHIGSFSKAISEMAG